MRDERVAPHAFGIVEAQGVIFPMGDLAYIFADVGGHTFTVRVDPLDIPQVGQVVPLRIDGGALRLFDAETQQAIDTGTPPAGASSEGTPCSTAIHNA